MAHQNKPANAGRLTRLGLIAPLALALAGMSGCAPFTWYRTDITACTAMTAEELAAKCAKHDVQVLRPQSAADPGYVLGFIEFDDQGQLWSRDQMGSVMKSVDTETSDDSRDFLLVVFVHGWKHNASFDDQHHKEDSNVAHFREALTHLSATEIELSNKIQKAPRQVIGIYLGWRGASITTPFIENLTFWDRKNTAHEVGHGEVTEVLGRLETIRQGRLVRRPDTRSRLIVVGHSFGGAVVFSALEQILESRFIRSAGTPQAPAEAEGFGNLVVLLNPAFEAQLYSPLSDMSSERKQYVTSQLPLLAILTSQADQATRLAFPSGRWFSTRFEKERTVTRINPATNQSESISQKQADIHAIGHFEPYRTHTLRGVPAPIPGTDLKRLARENVTSAAEASGRWQDDHPGNVINFRGSVLTRTNNSVGRNPYLVVSVDRNLIADHNDIWGTGIREFITNLILISSQPQNTAERAEQREKAQQ